MTFTEIQRTLEEKELVQGSQERLGSGGFEVPKRHPRRDVQCVGSLKLKRQILLASKFLQVSHNPERAGMREGRSFIRALPY